MRPAEDIRHPEKQPNSSKGGRKKYKRSEKIVIFMEVPKGCYKAGLDLSGVANSSQDLSRFPGSSQPRDPHMPDRQTITIPWTQTPDPRRYAFT